MEGLSQIGIKKEPSDDPDVQMVCEKADGLEFITVSVDQLITQPARQVTCTMPGCEQVFKSVPMLNFHLIKVHRQTVSVGLYRVLCFNCLSTKQLPIRYTLCNSKNI